MSIGVIVIIVVVVILIIAFIATYNGLVRLRNQVKNAWAQIDVQLKRRYDLIPNLIETVKGYVKHERETLEAVTNARNLAQQSASASVGERSKVEGELSSALSKLLAVVENYPDLKANQNFLALQAQLEGTENRIAVERMRYNNAVKAFNAYRRTVFGSMFASMRGLTQPREYFEAAEGAEAVPQVKF